MHVEFLVEEPSAEIVIRALAEQALGNRHTFDIHGFQGKHDMLAKLSQRLRAYSHWLQDGCVVLLVDRDTDDCHTLKAELESTVQFAGLCTPASAHDALPNTFTRIAVEELEAWYLGDLAALQQAFPGLPDLSKRKRFRDPDAVVGGTWEQLERELQRVGYYHGGLGKIDLARRVAPRLVPDRNHSHSFQVFWKTLCALGGR